MRFNFKFGKRVGGDKLTAEQRDVLVRLERGEITAEEAGRQLGGVVHEWRFSTGGVDPDEPPAPAHAETEEETTARELVERIAREVDEEMERESG